MYRDIEFMRARCCSRLSNGMWEFGRQKTGMRTVAMQAAHEARVEKSELKNDASIVNVGVDTADILIF